MKTNINITTEALKVDDKFIYVKCPLCYKSRYSKKPLIHKFPSLGNKDNRLEIVSCKCNEMEVLFCININDTTNKN